MKKLFLLVLLVLLTGLTVIIVDERLEVAGLKEVSPVLSKTLPVVLVSADEAVFELQLYENAAAEQLIKQLPQTVVMTRWGDGSYGGALAKRVVVSDKKDQRRAFFAGEVVLHQKRNNLFLMFGPTPVGLTVSVPMLRAFGGIPVGRLKEFSDLEQLSGVVEFSFQIKK